LRRGIKLHRKPPQRPSEDLIAMSKKRPSSGPSFLRILISLVLIIGILYVAKAVIVPLAIAVLLTFTLTPVVALIQDKGLGRVPAVLVTVILVLALFVGIGWSVGGQVNRLARELPDHQEKIAKKLADLRGSGDGAFGRLVQMIRELGAPPEPAPTETTTAKEMRVVVVRPDESLGFEQLVAAVGPVLEPLATTGLVVVLVIFMLIKREDLRNRVIGLLGHGHLTGTTRIIVDAAHRLSRFLLNLLLVNVGTGVIFGVGLLLIGVPYALLWGFLTAVLRFVPYVGTLFAVAFPLVLTFALSPDWTQFIAVGVFFVVLEAVTANVVEPLLFGHTTGVTPIALLVAAAFWTLLWGPIGLVLSTPLTLCLVVLGQHVPRLKFLALLLGDEPALAPHAAYYQRLLARDQKEAQQVVEQHAAAQDAERVYDDVLVPALVLARRDRRLGGLTAEDAAYIRQATREILAHLEAPTTTSNTPESPAPQATAPATNGQATRALILGCPAHDESEELALQMLGQLMKPDGCAIEVMSTRALPAVIEARVAKANPALVVIAVLPPGGLVQTRYLCKRLRARFAELPLVVSHAGEPRAFDQLLVRLREAGASYLTTSLLQTRGQLRQLLDVPAPPTPALSAAPAGDH
jgi:predicted PurR-regulated permease PerM